MTLSQDNKLAKNKAPVKAVKRGSVRGKPRPYKDGNRWKAKGYYLDLDGKQKHVTGTGSTQSTAIARRDF